MTIKSYYIARLFNLYGQDMLQLYYLYNSTCAKYNIEQTYQNGLKLNPDRLTESNQRLMTCLLDIDESLIDLNLTMQFFDYPKIRYPFNGTTPREYLLTKGYSGLLEIRMYITAWRYQLLTLGKYGVE